MMELLSIKRRTVVYAYNMLIVCLTILLSLSFLSISRGQGKSEDIDSLVRRLTGESSKMTSRERSEAFARVVDALVSGQGGLSSSNLDEIKSADEQLQRLCFYAGRPGAEDERSAISKALASKLTDNVPAQAKEYVLRHIERIGREECVPALARLLKAKEPRLREKARRALENNPSAAALNALRDALPEAKHRFRIAIINSLGARRDTASVKMLIDEARGNDEAIRIAAIEALSRIADPAAVEVISEAMSRGSDTLRKIARKNYLLLAENLAAKGEKESALKIYRQMLAGTEYERRAAIIGIGRVGGMSELTTIFGAISGNSDKVRGAAVEALSVMQGKEVTRAIAERLKDASPELKVTLLDLLARRGDSDLLPFFISAAKGKEEAVRIAALEGIGKLGDEGGAAVLLDALRVSKGDQRERDTAESAINRIPGKSVTRAIINALITETDRETRCVLTRVLGYRNDPDSLPTLTNLAKDKEESVRTEAFKAIGRLGSQSAMPAVLTALRAPTMNKVERDAAEYALRRMHGKEATAAMIRALKGAPEPLCISLLHVLGQRDDPAIVPLLLEAAKNPSEDVQLAAFQGLARAKDPRVLPVLMDAASKGSEKVRAVAAQGCMRFADEMRARDKQAALKIYMSALDTATRDEERRTAIRSLGEVGDPIALDKIRPYMKNRKLRLVAAKAMADIADKLPRERRLEAIDIYTEALKLNLDHRFASHCVEQLRKRGVNADFARKAGFVTFWWVIGPFPNPNGAMWEKTLPPEEEVNLKAKVRLDGKKYRWKPYHTPDVRGIVDLEKAIAPRENVGGYMYAEVTMPKAQEVLFKIGSDDQVACWLNGRKIHANRVNRGISPDQDIVKAHLKAGVNKILMKVLNDSGYWAGCLRITDEGNQPVKFEQRER